MTKHLLFVYGTLRRGGANAMTVRFPTARFISESSVNGRLYDLGSYPGLLLDESGPAVLGDVFEVDDALLKSLDAFEATVAYTRRPVSLSLETGSSAGWVYAPAQHPEFFAEYTLIASGDWIVYAGSQTALSGEHQRQ